MKIGLPGQFRWLEGIIASVFILNVFDGILTIIWVLTKKSTETNPMMDILIQVDPVLFISVKIALVLLGSYLLWRHRKQSAAVIAIFLAFIVYYAILILHLNMMNINIVLDWLHRQ